jgi:hypothetical protein
MTTRYVELIHLSDLHFGAGHRFSLGVPGVTSKPSTLLLRSVPCSERCVEGDWNELARRRGNGALPAAWYLARTYAGMRLAELGEIAGGVS